MTTQSNGESLASFLKETSSQSHLRVEADLGNGFVRLKLSEAEKRQAAQDIQCNEDIVIELLRNSRDAGARNIFLAYQKESDTRVLLVIDDGCGIPDAMHERIFEPRVTSKLDTAHMDKWGMHGRGMALYSISVHSKTHRVVCSQVGKGSSLLFETDASKLPEKADQSTFPRFEVQDNGTHAMRGPKNILRTAAEFALEHRHDCAVYCGSFTEIAATLYSCGMKSTTPSQRAFGNPDSYDNYAQMLAFAADPEDLARLLASLGLEVSERTCRRILDGEIQPVHTLLERLQSESFEKKQVKTADDKPLRVDARGLMLAQEDVDSFTEAVSRAYREIASKYYLEEDVKPQVSVCGTHIKVNIPLEKMR